MTSRTDNGGKCTAFFSGSFDPFTRGHESIVMRALTLFDNVVIGIGINPAKETMMSAEQRKEWIESVFLRNSRIKVISYSGMTTDAAREANATCIIRGVRNADDFIYEQQMAEYNRQASGLETLFLPALPDEREISSTQLRELVHQGKDIRSLLPHHYSAHLFNELFATR